MRKRWGIFEGGGFLITQKRERRKDRGLKDPLFPAAQGQSVASRGKPSTISSKRGRLVTPYQTLEKGKDMDQFRNQKEEEAHTERAQNP